MQLIFAAPFLLMGCLTFLLCISVQRWRRFALNSSFLCVALGPSLIIGLLLQIVPIKLLKLDDPKTLVHTFLLVLSGIVCVVIATIATIVHGRIVESVPTSLFRFYVTSVSFCVGGLCGIFLVLAGSIASIHYPEAIVVNSLIILLSGSLFAAFAYRNFVSFRKPRLGSDTGAADYKQQ